MNLIREPPFITNSAGTGRSRSKPCICEAKAKAHRIIDGIAEVLARLYDIREDDLLGRGRTDKLTLKLP
jgi:hypothetical protein